MKNLLVIIIILVSLTSCTQQQRAKKWGSTATIDVPINKKVINVTWKDNDVWILTKPMSSKDIAEVYEFNESSSWGILEGKLVIKEWKK